MDRRIKMLVSLAEAHVLLSTLTMMILSRKRKRGAERVGTADGSNEASGTDEDAETETDEVNGPTPLDENDASSSTTRPPKRANAAADSEMAEFTAPTDRLAKSIETLVSKVDTDLPSDLLQTLKSLPGFRNAHISFYYAHLVANPHVGRAFYNLPFDAKMDWVEEFIAERFPGVNH